MNIAQTALWGVTYYNPLKSSGGYTLFSPIGISYTSGKGETWLVDMEGHIVNRWQFPYQCGLYGYLLPNGHIVYAAQSENVHQKYSLPFSFTGFGTEIIEQDWDGNVVRTIPIPRGSHDFLIMPNGNVMYICYGDEKGILPDELAAKWKGGIPAEGKEKLYGDNIYEVDENGKIVWEWISYEHMDPEIDAICPLEDRQQWHMNTLFRCRDGNILVSPRHLNEFFKMEFPSGKIIARYGRGKIFHQHDCKELDNGNFLVFDNGSHRHNYGPPYSRVVEIDPNTDEEVWEYKAEVPSDFYSSLMAGAQRMPNGNTVICDSCSNSRIFEVTYEGELVWEYIVPLRVKQMEISIDNFNLIFRAPRYPSDYPGFKGKNLDPARFPWENQMYGPAAFKKSFVPRIF